MYYCATTVGTPFDWHPAYATVCSKVMEFKVDLFHLSVQSMISNPIFQPIFSSGRVVHARSCSAFFRLVHTDDFARAWCTKTSCLWDAQECRNCTLHAVRALRRHLARRRVDSEAGDLRQFCNSSWSMCGYGTWQKKLCKRSVNQPGKSGWNGPLCSVSFSDFDYFLCKS